MSSEVTSTIPAAATVPAAGPANDALQVVDQRLHPVRGVIPLHNHRGQFFPILDIHRWLHLSVASFKSEKIDFHVEGPLPDHLRRIVQYAHDPNQGFGVQASLRTNCAAPPEGLRDLAVRDLFDVALCPDDATSPLVDAWIDACAELKLPVRLELSAPLPEDTEALAERVARASVKVVDVRVQPLFGKPRAASDAAGVSSQVVRMNALVRAIAGRGIEANLVGLPLCHVDEDNLPHAYNSAQFFLDFQHYGKASYEFAQTAYNRRPWAVSKLVQITLGRETSRRTIIDGYILVWLMFERPAWLSLIALFRRLTRHMRFFANTPKPIEQTQEAYEAAIEEKAAQDARRLGPECSECAYRRICDNCPAAVRKALPGLGPKKVAGELVVGARQFTRTQPKHVDAIDAMRLASTEHQEALAAEALDIVTNTQPTKVFGFAEWSLENSYSNQMPGALQWFSLSNIEVRTWPIGWFDTPYTISVTFAEGIADQIGFGIGDYTRIVCPMESFRHQLVLHVDKDARYVLLRDGVRVEPTRFEDKAGLPTKVPSTAPVRLISHNIDRYLFTQNLIVWEGNRPATEQRTAVKYSVVIVSTRFARRLQAVLQSIAHQRDFDMREVEVIVAYVPGLDPTDDLLTSVQMVYPELRIVRAPFHEKNAKAKGFLINEAAKLAAGEWILLLDSDILIPPNMFAYLEEHAGDHPFVAPDSRKMLSAETTAKIMLGELEPWNEWEALMAGPGAIRRKEGGNLPVGFFQCVRAEFFHQIRYQEFDHFQGADWDFIVGMYQEFGPGLWLSDIRVCHLDHGGSQWFGANKQM